MTGAEWWWDTAVGQTAHLTRTFSAVDLRAYERLTGSTLPDRGVPEALLAGMVSALLGTRLPGPGTNYLKQALTFHSPAAEGSTLTAVVTITRVRPAKRLVDLDTRITGTAGVLHCSGRALVLAPHAPAAEPGTLSIDK